MAEHDFRGQPFLILILEWADGSQPLRFGPDEEAFDGILVNASFETEMPGGMGPGDFTVKRNDDLDILSLGRGLWANARLIDSEGRKVYEGRVTSTPKQGATNLEIQTEGWSKVTEDMETAYALFRDIDFSHWGPASRNHLASLLQSGYATFDPDVVTDPGTGQPALKVELDDAWNTGGPARCTAIYDPQGPGRLGSAGWTFDTDETGVAHNGLFGANWTLQVVGNPTDNPFAVANDVASANLIATQGSGTGTLVLTQADRYAEVYLQYGVSPAGAAGYRYTAKLFIPVYGRHGLTLRGAEPVAGFWVSDMLQWIFTTWCPQLKVAPDSFEGTSFIVPHSVFLDPTIPKDMIESLLLLGGTQMIPLDWMVYDDRTVKVATPGNYGSVWTVREDEGSAQDAAGPDSTSRPNAVRVTWDDGTGTKFSVAPSQINSDFTDNSLQITDPTHPANVAGMYVYKNVDMGISTQAGAVLLGQMYLADKNRQEWRGTVKATGTDGFIVNSAGAEQPIYMIRAGDRAIVSDSADTRERRIVGTSFEMGKREINLNIGPKPNYFDTLLAQAGATVRPGTGSIEDAPYPVPPPEAVAVSDPFQDAKAAAVDEAGGIDTLAGANTNAMWDYLHSIGMPGY